MMDKEERPRITITAERHDELVAREKFAAALEDAGNDLVEKTIELLRRYERRGEAARRLAEIHKSKLAAVENKLECHQLAGEVVESWKNQAEDKVLRLESELVATHDLLEQGTVMINKLSESAESAQKQARAIRSEAGWNSTWPFPWERDDDATASK